MNVTVAAAPYVDRITGINIVKKILISPKPSSRDASIMSCGKDLADCLKSIIIKGVEIVGRISAAVLLIKCILEGALMLLSFINPFGEDFFRVKTVLYLLGEGIGLIVDIYLIWIVYCFMISLKKK